ncbi:MAG: response regulator, partial [Gemmatimonadota bacterium]
EVVHQDDRARLLETVARVAAAPQGSVEIIRFRALGGDGSWRRLESAITNLLEEPTVKGLVANTRDITAREQLEEQFRQAQKMEGVGRLAGGIAHDFNNLLTVILGNASLVERELPAESPLRADAAMIRVAAERGAELTRQLLAFARRQVVEPKVVDLNASLRELESLIGRVLGPTVELRQDLAGDTGAVRIDPVQLQQVMVNLAVNAKDAMPDGGRMIIRTRRRPYSIHEARETGLSGPGDYVHLDVEDSGTGIALEARDRLFEPFYTTKADGKGTGLGLATCYGIARQNDGVILAQDSPEGGALFRLILPRATRPLTEPVADPEPGRQGWETVLVVDDEPAVRSLVVRTLRHQGYQVLEAEDGVAGEMVSQGHAEPIHVLVTDVVMPRMGGLELAERIRRQRPQVKLLFMSGFADGFDFRDQAALRGAEFLEKPFRPQALVARLRTLLDRPTVEPQSDAP